MNDWTLAITAIATVVNAVAVVVLVIVTISYAKSAKRQAAASEQQAKAAFEQARAAHEQSSISTATLHELRKQLYDQRLMELSLVEGEIKSTLENVEHYSAPGPRNNLESAIRANALPLQVALLPEQPGAVLESARRVSPELAVQISQIFDELRIAKSALEGLSCLSFFSLCLPGARQSTIRKVQRLSRKP